MAIVITSLIVTQVVAFAGVLLGYRIGAGEWPWR
jgi:hypothetical protein